jgi:hypothetical protein
MLNTNSVQPAGSETCAYRTAALKGNSTKCVVTDRLQKDCNLWNYCCRLNEEKFDLGSGCTKGSRTLWYLWKVTFISVKNIFDQSSVVFCALQLIILCVLCIFYLFNVFINVILCFCKPNMWNMASSVQWQMQRYRPRQWTITCVLSARLAQGLQILSVMWRSQLFSSA